MSSAAALGAKRIAVIGGGAMGEAIVSGWLTRGLVAAESVTIAERSEARCSALSALAPLAGVRIVTAADAALPADVVLLAVKPQVIDAVVSEHAHALAGSLVVSIAVGVSTARLESLLPAGTRVVRVMPNTPAMVGEGMAVVSGGSEAGAQDVDLVREMFAAIGSAIVMEERYQNAAAAISGSGPAYFALVIDALSRAGVSAGLPRATAQQLAVQTMLGTAKMLAETGMHPESLVDGVTSPGGTTIAALGELEAAALRSAFARAVKAAVSRAEELAQ